MVRFPTGLAFWKGGLLVGSAPDILYFKDEDGDGKADKREVFLTGFSDAKGHVDSKGLLNSLRWGLDNRLYISTSYNGATLPGEKGQWLSGGDISLDPRDSSIRVESGGGSLVLASMTMGGVLYVAIGTISNTFPMQPAMIWHPQTTTCRNLL